MNKLTNKGFAKITVIIIVAVLVLGGGIWFWQSQKNNSFIFPSGGEKLMIGNKYDIRWLGATPNDKNFYVSLHLARPCSGFFDKTCGPYNNTYSLLPDRTENDGLFSWTVPSGIDAKYTHDYYLTIDCVDNCGSVSSGKSNVFNITEGTADLNKTLLVDLKINSSDSPSPITYDSTFTISWTSTGATYCTSLGEQIPSIAGGVWGDLNKKLPTSGSMTLRGSALNTNGGKTYVPQLNPSINCYNESGQSAFDNGQISIVKP